MRKSDRTWRPDLPPEPAPLRMWLLTAVFIAVLAGAIFLFAVRG